MSIATPWDGREHSCAEKIASGKRDRIPVPGPSKIVYGGKSPVRMSLLIFPGKSYGLGGRKRIKKKKSSRRRKRWKTKGEKMVDFWCRFFHGLVPIFSRFGADFSRFVRDINGERKTSPYWWSLSRLVFHGLPPLELSSSRCRYEDIISQCLMNSPDDHLRNFIAGFCRNSLSRELRLQWPSTEWKPAQRNNPADMGKRMKNGHRPEMASEKFQEKGQNPIFGATFPFRRPFFSHFRPGPFPFP